MRIDIRSDLSGVVQDLIAVVGVSVGSDAPLLILESMKMEIPICSPRPGQLVELCVQIGDAVVEGQLLAVLDAP